MRKKLFFGALLLIAGLCVLPAVAGATGPRDVGSTLEIHIDDAGAVKVDGARVTTKTESAITATTTFGAYVVRWALNVNTSSGSSATNIVRRWDGKCSLSEIQIGDYISFKGPLDTVATQATVNATWIKDWSIQGAESSFPGIITSVDTANSKFVITKSDGKMVTVVVASTTQIKRGTTAVALADLKVGNKVDSTAGIYNNLTNTLQATSVTLNNAAPKIELTSPKGGEKLGVGQVFTFKGDSSALTVSDQIRINILNCANASVGSCNVDPVLVLTTTGDKNSYDWTVPPTFLKGTKYKVRVGVTKEDGVIYTDTLKSFFSVTAPATPIITVVSPKNKTIFTAGKDASFSWKSTALTADDTIMFNVLECVNAQTNCNTIPLGLSVSGDKKSAVWRIPADFRTGNKFKLNIYVRKSGATYLGNSTGFFSIKKSSVVNPISSIVDSLQNFGNKILNLFGR